MNNKYKLILLKSLLLSEIFISYSFSDVNYKILEKDFINIFNNNYSRKFYTEEEKLDYKKTMNQITVFFSSIVLVNGASILIEEKSQKIYNKIESVKNFV